MPAEALRNKPVIIVDDVANTGRTIFYAVQPLLKAVPKKVEVAVLIDRKHKSFPMKADYVGLSLATTLLNNIEVNIRGGGEMAVLKKSDLRKRDTGTRYIEVPLPNGDSVLLRSFSRANHREWRKAMQRSSGSEDPGKYQDSNEVRGAMWIGDS